MHRREALSLTLMLPGLWPGAALRAQPAAGPRAAVVIGVDKAGDLPVLRAAKSGARQVAAWLEAEGFEVKLFVDDGAPVVAGELFDAVNTIVARGTASQLVVYFAGHGFINGYSEHWMLSKAPDNPNEAVSLVESVTLARQSAVPNVVFISDACRSRSDSLRTERVRGSLIFPAPRSVPANPSDIDLFLATLVGDPSWEVPVAESAGAYEGVYTATFLDAFKHPAQGMVKVVDGKPVVPNAQLKAYLAREVPLRAQRVSIRLNQRPDTQVMSGEATYIGRAIEVPPWGAPAPAPAPPAAPVATVHELAAVRIAAAERRGTVPDRVTINTNMAALDRAARETGFDSARDTIATARALPQQNAARTGFALTGARLAAVVTTPRARVDFANAGNAEQKTALVQVELRGTPAASVALRFADGRGTVLAALDGFIGNVVVDAGGVSNVSYLPSRANPLHDTYRHEEARIAELHATVATAARFGVFRIDGARDARNRAAAQMADRIRMLKGIDPTLGIYAAYAYADAGLPGRVRSVMGFMRADLQVDLFDVAMLAGALAGKPPVDPNAAVPFVPMLAQGWSLLRVSDVRLPEAAAAARDDLRPGLWTTLGADAMAAVTAVLREGRVR